MAENIKFKLENAHNIFLESIKDEVNGEFLVGSTVYAEEKDLSEKSDLDIICVVEKRNLRKFLETEYLKGLISSDVAFEVLDKKIADYFVLKTYINNILLSIDVLTPDFFRKICNINLASQMNTYLSSKFGNEPQVGEYSVFDFNGILYKIKKENSEYQGGHVIKLPLFFIKNGEYVYGIPTIKYITNRICIDKSKMIRSCIQNLIKNLIRRLEKEHPGIDKEEKEIRFINLLRGRNKFPANYRQSIINELNEIFVMEDIKHKIEKVREEVYRLFRDDTEEKRYQYVRRDWIFPNHLDIMIDLSKDMCKKYGGDIVICELAALLHDIGLVYKRETASPEGHELRSVEYTTDVLKKFDFPQNIVDEVIECIVSTEKDEKGKPLSINAQILRTSDIVSQFIGVHYFAKAAFSGDWKFHYNWMKDRVESCYNKVCFEDERKIVKPIRDYMIKAMELYEKYNKNYPKKIAKKEGGESKNNDPSKNN